MGEGAKREGRLRGGGGARNNISFVPKKKGPIFMFVHKLETDQEKTGTGLRSLDGPLSQTS